MFKTEIYTKDWCPFSTRAKEDLQRLGIAYEEIDVTADEARELEMIRRSGRHTVPQIFIDGQHIGGSDDLRLAEVNGALARILNGTGKGEAA